MDFQEEEEMKERKSKSYMVMCYEMAIDNGWRSHKWTRDWKNGKFRERQRRLKRQM